MNVIADPAAPTTAAFEAAIAAWRRALGAGHVSIDTAACNRDTSSFAGVIPAALRPGSTAEVQDVVRIARQYRVPLHPVSTGHNWGYGSAVPPRFPAVLLDLSRLKRIIAFDRDTGIVTLEPGVTQGDLYAYLSARALPYVVPVTGAGPSCSLIGNALERGFGITPFTDHFGAVMALTAVLPDGTLYRSHAHRAGPRLDALFAQSNLGIVVEAKIALAWQPARCGALLFTLDDDRGPSRLAASLRDLLAECGGGIGAVNLMSRDRVCAMLRGQRRVDGAPHHADVLPPGAWFGFASLYGDAGHFRATCRSARRALRGQAGGLRIITRDRLRWMSRIAAIAAAVGRTRLGAIAARLEAALDVVEGKPTAFALALAYAASGRAGATPLDPARDGCGLFWYAPVVPLSERALAAFITFAETTCRRHGLPCSPTLTVLSPRHVAATLPLLFDRADAAAEQRAVACYEDLHIGGLAQGFAPYRVGAPFMHLMTRPDGGAAALARTIKRAVDPDGIVSPGRYGLG